MQDPVGLELHFLLISIVSSLFFTMMTKKFGSFPQGENYLVAMLS